MPKLYDLESYEETWYSSSMISEIVFTKASGAGNDFIIVDNRSNQLPEDKPRLARQLCSRHFGVGGDGLLLIESSAIAHFKMKYYNSDGSYGGMCGNGGRCLARYAFVNQIAPRVLTFEALDFLYQAEVLDGRVRLVMKDPTDFRTQLELSSVRDSLEIHFVNTGSPHVVIFVKNVEGVAVELTGRAIRHDPLFLPEGTNVNFVEIKDDRFLHLRTYERGVETETLACGTGSVASGIIAHLYKGLKFPITIYVKSGEILSVSAEIENNKIRRPTLEGSAHILFSGKLLYDSEEGSLVGVMNRETSNPA